MTEACTVHALHAETPEPARPSLRHLRAETELLSRELGAALRACDAERYWRDVAVTRRKEMEEEVRRLQAALATLREGLSWYAAQTRQLAVNAAGEALRTDGGLRAGAALAEGGENG